ncbi:hypothetical protein [Streptomyces albireticuli]|uniref:Uncharacterized protein n=1 Tax=Streptomyces albireticuli TaxID=1940 RepID=A0A2A2D5Q4_9ACTN|nr:hypothetical protein [Streptomyces albireticuli]MCD9194586.1 hypothetical protein [Streptomyces albireticuli]PAU47783.1 hypothetical protein CK936_16780 [Streptomyces albireticuli]
MGIRVVVDIFSGRPNPSWEIHDADEVRELLELVARNRAAVAEVASGYTGLGFRGVQVELTDDLDTAGLPPRFELAGGGALDPYAGAEIAERLVRTMPAAAAGSAGPPETGDAGDATGTVGYPEEFLESVCEEIRRTARQGAGGATTVEPHDEDDGNGPVEAEGQIASLGDGAALACAYDVTPFNPAFWNSPDTQPHNNCYNFAVNRRTNTFAQPGRAHGYTIPGTVRCNEVATGALRDGLRVWGNCQPPGSLRYVLALVTGTFPGGFRDYHWYRLHPGGIWAHKPGGTPARNTDNSGRVITDPYTCDRRPYGEWCGLFQSHNSVVIR